MAGRKREGVLDTVMELPWWFGVGLAVLVYLFLRYVTPEMVPPNRPIYHIAALAASQLAWLFAIPFLIAGMASAGRQLVRGQLLVRQSDLESIRGLSWLQFEYLVGEAFRRQGYVVEERGGSVPDGGVDLDLWKSGKKTVVQCKRWKSKQVGVNIVRELYGVMTSEGADEAIVVSSGDYTKEARKFARGKPIRLIDGQALFRIIQSVKQADARGSQAVPRQPRFEPSLARQAAGESPACPKCEKPMVRRTAKNGPQVGEGFWGCSGYPECRGTRPLV